MPKPLFLKLVAQVAIGLFCVLFGCIFSIQTCDRILFILSVTVGFCSAIRCINFYLLVKYKKYQIVDGYCTKNETALLKNKRHIILTESNGQEHIFTFNKEAVLFQRHYYRIYFISNRNTISQSNIIGYEELSVSGAPSEKKQSAA